MTPVKSPANDFQWGPSPAIFHQSPSRIPVDFSPPLIAMVVVVAAAFVIVTYFRLISRHLLPPVIHLFRRWRLRWRLWRHRRSYDPSAGGDIESLPSDSAFESTTTFHYLSPYGLDDAVIKTIPLSIYTKTDFKKGSVDSTRDCAVCLLEFEENDYVRTLPACSHAFHVDCIDIWLRSHANCPLCRAGIFRPESPFIPLMASRIRPRLDVDDYVLESILSESRNEVPIISEDTPVLEIGPAFDQDPSPGRIINETDLQFNNGRNFLLKRSYSFGFERNLASDRLMTEAATASPWRYSRRSFWSKRTSPFSSVSKPRVFSLRYYRGMKSPFFRRGRGSSFFPLSESNVRYSGGGSSRRSKSLTSPFFMRSSTSAVMFSSSRLRCGDPEALLSPERLNRR
ncbi:zinc finger protein [Macleaya cordata]|uniref:RING-type E3 ubiquitin transferase n=1 Tax=Macleaya cordata TaxID=56857 RepID=A0A200R7G3_MACCD|nr:zinc finger protein [Macleaya cordata]